jgi:signal transduction histidine kinase
VYAAIGLAVIHGVVLLYFNQIQLSSSALKERQGLMTYLAMLQSQSDNVLDSAHNYFAYHRPDDKAAFRKNREQLQVSLQEFEQKYASRDWLQPAVTDFVASSKGWLSELDVAINYGESNSSQQAANDNAYEAASHAQSQRLTDYIFAKEADNLRHGRYLSAMLLTSALLSLALFLHLFRRLNFEAKQNESKAQIAMHANAAKSNFLANMSHELRTPLNAIIGFSELMYLEKLGKVENAKYREYVNDISQCGKYLLNLVNNLLDLAKIEAGKFKVDRKWIYPSEVISETIKLMEPIAKENRVQLLTPANRDHTQLYADERSLKQMLLNILSNAIKFTGEDGQVMLVSRALPDGRLAITIRDTGIGIDPNEVPKLLRPFEQSDNQFIKKTPGTGLGLAVVESLIRLHGGAIELQSQLGQGTAATLLFPASSVRQMAVPLSLAS